MPVHLPPSILANTLHTSRLGEDRTSERHRDSISSHASSSHASSRAPNFDAASFAFPRNPPPPIPDEDSESVKTPISSIGPRSSAAPSNRGPSTSTNPNNQPGSTQPTSAHTKSATHSESGLHAASLNPTEEQHAEVQGQLAVVEGRKVDLVAEELADRQLQLMYRTAREIIDSLLAVRRQERQADKDDSVNMAQAGLGDISDAARKRVVDYYSGEPKPLPQEEYQKLIEAQLKSILRVRMETRRMRLALQDTEPDDDASTTN